MLSSIEESADLFVLHVVLLQAKNLVLLMISRIQDPPSSRQAPAIKAQARKSQHRPCSRAWVELDPFLSEVSKPGTETRSENHTLGTGASFGQLFLRTNLEVS